MWKNILTSLRLLGVMTLILGIAYPMVITAAGQVLFPFQANGSTIVRDGELVGSTLIGQSFESPKYFWGRLSATGSYPCNAMASSGSNFGPMHADLVSRATARLQALHNFDPDLAMVPSDLVTASASGLDPHISVEAAMIQVPRVAESRSLSQDAVHDIVIQCTSSLQLGILGEPRVHVLQMNLLLDKLHP